MLTSSKTSNFQEFLSHCKRYPLFHGSRANFEQVVPMDNQRGEELDPDISITKEMKEKYIDIIEETKGGIKFRMGIKWQRLGKNAAAFFSDNPLVSLIYTKMTESKIPGVDMGIDMYQEPDVNGCITAFIINSTESPITEEEMLDSVFGVADKPDNIAYMYMASLDAAPLWEPGLGKLECISTDCAKVEATKERLEINPRQLISEASKAGKIKLIFL